MEVRSRACMAAVIPKVCVQLTVVEGDRVMQVTRNKMKPFAHDVNERVSNVGVPVTETAWSLTNQSKATSKEVLQPYCTCYDQQQGSSDSFAYVSCGKSTVTICCRLRCRSISGVVVFNPSSYAMLVRDRPKASPGWEPSADGHDIEWPFRRIQPVRYRGSLCVLSRDEKCGYGILSMTGPLR